MPGPSPPRQPGNDYVTTGPTHCPSRAQTLLWGPGNLRRKESGRLPCLSPGPPAAPKLAWQTCHQKGWLLISLRQLSRLFPRRNVPARERQVRLCSSFCMPPEHQEAEPRSRPQLPAAPGQELFQVLRTLLPSFMIPTQMAECWAVPAGECGVVLSRVRLFVTPWTVARQPPLSMGFPRREYWSGLPFPLPGGLANPGIEPPSLVSPALQAIRAVLYGAVLRAFSSTGLNSTQAVDAHLEAQLGK